MGHLVFYCRCDVVVVADIFCKKNRWQKAFVTVSMSMKQVKQQNRLIAITSALNVTSHLGDTADNNSINGSHLNSNVCFYWKIYSSLFKSCIINKECSPVQVGKMVSHAT